MLRKRKYDDVWCFYAGAMPAGEEDVAAVDDMRPPLGAQHHLWGDAQCSPYGFVHWLLWPADTCALHNCSLHSCDLG